MNNRNVIVFDIDGTLANCTHRLHHILEKPVCWDTFDSLTPEDIPIQGMVRLFHLVTLNPFVEIVILTGRADRKNNREMTIKWLARQGIDGQLYNRLEMRGEKDRRPAAEVKLERLHQLGYDPTKIITIFEDDPATVKHLRAHGYHVCNVDDRTFIKGEHEGGPE